MYEIRETLAYAIEVDTGMKAMLAGKSSIMVQQNNGSKPVHVLVNSITGRAVIARFKANERFPALYAFIEFWNIQNGIGQSDY